MNERLALSLLNGSGSQVVKARVCKTLTRGFDSRPDLHEFYPRAKRLAVKFSAPPSAGRTKLPGCWNW